MTIQRLIGMIAVSLLSPHNIKVGVPIGFSLCGANRIGTSGAIVLILGQTSTATY